MTAPCANVFDVRIFFQMRACIVMADWRRCLTTTTAHNLCIQRLSLQNRLLAVFAVMAERARNEQIAGTNLMLLSLRSTARVYRLQVSPQQTPPHPPWTFLSLDHVSDLEGRY